MKKEHQNLTMNEILDSECIRESFMFSLNTDKRKAIDLLLSIGFTQEEAVEAVEKNSSNNLPNILGRLCQFFLRVLIRKR